MTSTTVRDDPITTGPAARPPRMVTTATGLAFAALYVIGFLFALVAASLCYVVFLVGLVQRLGGLRANARSVATLHLGTATS